MKTADGSLRTREGRWRGQEKGITKEHKEAIRNQEHVHYLDFGVGLMGACVCQNS